MRTNTSIFLAPAACLLGAALMFSAVGCDDPAKDKSKAVTTEATATPQATTPAITSAAAVGNAAPADATTYGFDQTNSKVEWTGSKVTGKHDGSFTTFKGAVKASPTAPEAGSVTVDIDTKSLTVAPEKLQTHLKSKDFFDVDQFPKASFVSTSVKKGGDKGASHTITGNLTLHGVTKSVTFPATVKLDGDNASVDAEFSINRKDFGLLYPGAANDLIRDDVVIKLTVRGKKGA